MCRTTLWCGHGTRRSRGLRCSSVGGWTVVLAVFIDTLDLELGPHNSLQILVFRIPVSPAIHYFGARGALDGCTTIPVSVPIDSIGMGMTRRGRCEMFANAIQAVNVSAWSFARVEGNVKTDSTRPLHSFNQCLHLAIACFAWVQGSRDLDVRPFCSCTTGTIDTIGTIDGAGSGAAQGQPIAPGTVMRRTTAGRGSWIVE